MKYSKEQLKKFALDFLYSDGEGDFKADQLLMVMQHITGMSHEQIRYEIRKLTNED